MDDLNKEQRDIVYHASGLSQSNKQYRDYYNCSATDPLLLDLVAKGYMDGPKHYSSLARGSAYFYLTQKGIETAKEIRKADPNCRHKLTNKAAKPFWCDIQWGDNGGKKYAWFWKDVTCPDCLAARSKE